MPDDAHWDEYPFRLSFFDGVVLHCNWSEALRNGTRSPYAGFVGTRLNDGKLGWLSPIHDV